MRDRRFWQRKLVWNITVAEFSAWLFYNLFWGAFFFVVMILSYQIKHPLGQVRIIAIDVALKMLCTLPAWWFLLRVWKKKTFSLTLLFHLLYIPFFSFSWVYSFGHILNDCGLGKFDFSTMMYDVYIGAFFYSLQFALYHAYRFYLRTKEQLIREQALKDLAYQSEIKALKAQIEPHFLFNTLNSISASVPPSLEKTRVLIAQLADTFRYALKVSECQSVRLEEELNFVKTWLALEHYRFGNRLQVDFRIDPSVLRTNVPPMILQPLVENALNHGISPLVNGGTVTIICQREEEFIHITISDTGIGYSGDLDILFTKGIGLKSTAERIDRLYNEKLTARRNLQGLAFMFRIPLTGFQLS
ncbi:histidine kinase [Terrimonas sp. NA20]|uniref:Histidine kinase n=1 Tax=Terrimonas ginsenosidimutans TaxID=2908004 RepID=A0ABS9KZ43_9BACT|nr:histidine kinase [Terrimonas ginsenosidimutans]MCG2617566.1 histidine kinase [Terrimonas ginsenosidimutans]